MFVLLLLCGCEATITKEQKDYQQYVQQLQEKKAKNFDTKFPFEIEVSIDSLVEDELVYSVVIDQPKKVMKNVRALVIHDARTKDIFPSIGILDESLNLIPNEVDESKKNVKGIALIGYIQTKKRVSEFHTNIKVMVLYEDEDGNPCRSYYYTKI